MSNTYIKNIQWIQFDWRVISGQSNSIQFKHKKEFKDKSKGSRDLGLEDKHTHADKVLFPQHLHIYYGVGGSQYNEPPPHPTKEWHLVIGMRDTMKQGGPPPQTHTHSHRIRGEHKEGKKQELTCTCTHTLSSTHAHTVKKSVQSQCTDKSKGRLNTHTHKEKTHTVPSSKQPRCAAQVTLRWCRRVAV